MSLKSSHLTRGHQGEKPYGLIRQTNSQQGFNMENKSKEEILIEKLMLETPSHLPLPLSFSNNQTKEPKKPKKINSKL